jgi:hypothetical protein
MFKKLIQNTTTRYIAAILAACLLVYIVFAPLLIQHLFPQYNIVKKYTNIAVCTDLAPGTPSNVFLPISCSAVDKSKALACISNGASGYVSSKSASPNEKTVCPTLVSGNDTTGKKNPALATLPISESSLQVIVSFLQLLVAIVIMVVLWAIIRALKRKKHDSIVD